MRFWSRIISLAVLSSIVARAEPIPLTLDQTIQRVVDQNLRIRAEKLNLAATKSEARAERGLFEPEFVASFGRESNTRQNTRERFLSQGASIFDEENETATAAIETTLALGTKVRIGGQTRRLSNNLQITGNDEYESFAGLNITQPLLKGAGMKATLAQLRLAASRNEVVLHETRRQLTSILSQAELTYWDLARAMAEDELRQQSLSTAEKILFDNRARVEAGRMSDLEVRRADAGLALRRAQALESHQRVVDLSSLLRIYFGEVEGADAPVFKPVDALGTPPPVIDFINSRTTALISHPGYLARRAEFEQAGYRLDYARNQRLPQLDLKASYGYNGLDRDFADSWSSVRGSDFDSWYVGAELRVPILGGIRDRNYLSAARSRFSAAQLEIVSTEIEIGNLLNALIKRIRSQENQIAGYQAAADVAQTVLDAELDALDSGSSDSRRVFDSEQDVFDARTTVLSARADYRRSLVEFSTLEGTYLRRHSVDLASDGEKIPVLPATL